MPMPTMRAFCASSRRNSRVVFFAVLRLLGVRRLGVDDRLLPDLLRGVVVLRLLVPPRVVLVRASVLRLVLLGVVLFFAS